MASIKDEWGATTKIGAIDRLAWSPRTAILKPLRKHIKIAILPIKLLKNLQKQNNLIEIVSISCIQKY